jgi:hypothetical protein
MTSFPYATHLNVLFSSLEKIALDPLVASVRDAWYNQTLVRVNDSVVRCHAGTRRRAKAP